MNQLTIRGFDDDLKERIRSLAEREGISLNRAAVKLLKRGVGLMDGGEGMGRVGNSLDHLFGKWSKEEADEFNAIIEEECERIDESIWQ